MMVNEIDKQTYLLFNRTYGDDTSQEYDLLLDKVEQQITEFGWDKTFESKFVLELWRSGLSCH